MNQFLVAKDFHCHLTLDSTAINNKEYFVPKGWKETDIVLIDRTHERKDIMLTKHFRVGNYVKYKTAEQIRIEVSKLRNTFPISRIKIEQDSGFLDDISRERYAEIHMLCYQGEQCPEGWAKSTNPRRTVDGLPLYFFNRRVRHPDNFGRKMSKVKEGILKEVEGINYIEIKFEQLYYDSDSSSDSWWA